MPTNFSRTDKASRFEMAQARKLLFFTFVAGLALLAFAYAKVRVSPAGHHATLTTLILADGTEVHGELVHSYVQANWWHPTAKTTYAVFQPQGFAASPGDQSLQFLSTPEVLSVTPPSAIASNTYQPFLRRKKIALESPPLKGVSYVITHSDRYHLEEDGYGDFAWDFVRTNHSGRRFQGDGTANTDYLVWGDPVYLPVSGTVVEVVRDEPDNTPGSYTPGAPNNMVGVHLEGAYSLYLLHFQQGSIPDSIEPGMKLDAGTYLGKVGNAGVSLEPHLHITMLWWDQASTPPRFWSVPSEFLDIHARQAAERKSTPHDFLDPPSGTWISASSF